MDSQRGLTVGKFAPFHKGHQFLIETALSQMDEVIVIIYEARETTSVPLNIRAGWIRKLYPDVQVIEAWDGPTEVGDTPEIKKKHEDYILNRLKLQGITHFYSSEFYGEHMSLALGAVNRIVDYNRQTVPISGTQIRKDTFAYREYLHPWVYRDLITNVVFLGAPSTGKTTLASRLAQEYDTVWMPEYGREYWEKHQVNRRLSLEQLVEIASEHLNREEELLYQANRYLFTDTNAITTYMFSLYYHNTAERQLAELANRAASRYDLVFVCDVDIPYDDTWDRSGDVNRRIFQKQIVNDLIVRKIPFFLVQGELETRVKYVKGVLDKYRKYENLLDLFVQRQ
ncbi:AAA family ATPase [Microcoleus sp. FACHB-831]|uniref:AAA family ATPase n=1 Tax=Microcoleus sp. FACHB-831 TaxID=2692827 RepID=UPI0016878849|nr:AAA family ATPase [Microcoleus sp. FACHB-831]MBD1919756.1 AAA family ATPase [Microcoleus sp. FACHB-831]